MVLTGKKEVIMLSDEHLVDLNEEGNVLCVEVTRVNRCAIVLCW